MDIFLYLAIDPDGTEVASNSELFRVWDRMKEFTHPPYWEEHPLESYCPNQWMDTVDFDEEGYDGRAYHFNGVTLPPGTIEKMTGKKMTWEDDSVELTWKMYEKTMEYLYFAVNPDGTEISSNFSLFRAWDQMTKWSTEDYRKEHPLENYCENQWMNCVEETDYGYYGEDYSFDGTTLPPGSIEKFTGHKLTWEDEPIRIMWDK